MNLKRSDLDFIRDSEAAIRNRPSRVTTLFLLGCALFFCTFIFWANYAELEEVTRGQGRVIPSSKKQIVQSLEGGIVKSLLVREGDRVKKGQTLLVIDDTRFSSDLGELEARRLGLLVQTMRLRHEAESSFSENLEFPQEMVNQAKEVVDSEGRLFEIRRRNLNNQLAIMKNRLEQKKLELEELEESKLRISNGIKIARREYDLTAPLARKGIVSQIKILQLEREISNLEGQLATTNKSIPRIKAGISESEREIEEQVLIFQQDAQRELNEKLAELTIIRQSLTAAKDRVVRAELKSPVDGIIQKLYINTIGGVVRASEPLVEVTPLEDSLLVEVRVSPRDIAFIRPGQDATVKISAYDYTIYGVLDGKVGIISSDSTLDNDNNESYYLVTIETKDTSLKRGNEILPIIPGMVATTDIITGKKSVLNYLIKPIIKARHEALRER